MENQSATSAPRRPGPHPAEDITPLARVLRDWQAGEARAVDWLTPLIYAVLQVYEVRPARRARRSRALAAVFGGHPAGRGYGKLIIAAALGAALASAASAAIRQATRSDAEAARAQISAEEARRLASSLLSELAEAPHASRGASQARQLAAERAVAYLMGLVIGPGDPIVAIVARVFDAADDLPHLEAAPATSPAPIEDPVWIR